MIRREYIISSTYESHSSNSNSNMHSPSVNSTSIEDRGVVVGAVSGGALSHARLVDSPKQHCESAAVEAQDRQIMATTTTTTTTDREVVTVGKRTLTTALRSYQYITSGFYKFLARFSGEWRWRLILFFGWSTEFPEAWMVDLSNSLRWCVMNLLVMGSPPLVRN